MKKFDYFEVTADIGILAYGSDLNELFENAAIAMFNLMCDLGKVRAVEKREIELEAESIETLLVEWLTNLLALRDIYGMMFSKFRVRLENLKLSGEAWGEETRDEHELKVEVKAATYHMLEIKKNDIWKARLILDI